MPWSLSYVLPFRFSTYSFVSISHLPHTCYVSTCVILLNLTAPSARSEVWIIKKSTVFLEVTPVGSKQLASSAYLMKMEAICSSETAVKFYQANVYISEDINLHIVTCPGFRDE
jgi:hypothetical protein